MHFDKYAIIGPVRTRTAAQMVENGGRGGDEIRLHDVAD